MTPNKLFVCLIFLFVACTSRPKSDHPYTSGGLTMMLPPYWNVTKDKTDPTDSTRLITIEDKSPRNTGAYAVIGVLNDTLDLEIFMEILIRQTTGSMTKREVPIQLTSKTQALRIGNAQALRVYFECPIPAQLISGTLTVFRVNGNTYSLTFSADGKNSKEKDAIVDRIIRSFTKYSE